MEEKRQGEKEIIKEPLLRSLLGFFLRQAGQRRGDGDVMSKGKNRKRTRGIAEGRLAGRAVSMSSRHSHDGSYHSEESSERGGKRWSVLYPVDLHFTEVSKR